MKTPIIIKCNCMFPLEEIKEVRETVLKQLEEGVTILPPGFEVVTDEEKEEIFKLYKGMTPKMQSVIKEIMEIEQTRGDISKLKGENK